MGNIMNKYRVHEVAKDFGVPTKTIVEILTKYASAPKNHMQVLSDSELSLIFDYLTQKNPVSSIEVIFADVYQEEKAAPAKRLALAMARRAALSWPFSTAAGRFFQIIQLSPSGTSKSLPLRLSR